MVMYGGRLVEALPSRALVRGGRHPYTRGLLESEPHIDAPPRVMLKTIPGEPPDIRTRNKRGCPFQPRCPNAIEACVDVMPPLVPIDGDPGHDVACHNPVSDAKPSTVSV